MRLIEVSFKKYKVLEDQKFVFEENPFFWTAPNETGKSTLIEGIKDAFALDPKTLQAKKTQNSAVNPVIKVTFEINGCYYTLKVNAQDNKVVLTGNDGTELESIKYIEDFFQKKGYKFFPEVLGKLLILKERDLNIETKKGLKEIINSLLKSIQIEELKRVIEGQILLKKEGFRRSSLGKDIEEINKKLIETNKKIDALLQKYQEYKKNKEELENTRKEIQNKLREKQKLEQKIDKEKKLLVYLTYKQKEKELEELLNKKKEIIEQIEKKEKQEKKWEEEKKAIETKIDQIFDAIQKITNQKIELTEKKEILNKIKKHIKLLEEIKKIDRKLGPFKAYNIEDLKRHIEDWRIYNSLCERTKGKLHVLSGEGKVILSDGKELKKGEKYEFQGTTTLKYKDLVLEIFASQSLDKAKEKVKELERKFGNLQNLRNITSLLEKRERLAQTLELKESLEQLKEKEEAISKKLNNFQSLEKEIKEKETLKQKLLKKRKDLEKEIENLKNLLTSLKIKKQQIEDEIKQTEKSLEDIIPQVKSLTLGEVEDFKKEGDRDPRALSSEIEAREEQLKILEETLKALQEKKSYQEGLTKNEPDLKELEDLFSFKRNLEKNLQQIKHTEKILRFSLDVISELREKINEQYIKRFEEYVREIFAYITDQHYIDVRFDAESLLFEGETFKRNWKVVRKDQVEFHIEHLSDGTSSQLLLSARLALIRLFLQDQKAFLLLDEPFAYFDEKRRQRTLEKLHALAQSGWQIIIVSANP